MTIIGLGGSFSFFHFYLWIILVIKQPSLDKRWVNFFFKKYWSSTRESLLKGKHQYGWPPCTYNLDQQLFRLKLFLSFSQNEEVNRTESSFPSIRFPCINYYKHANLLLKSVDYKIKESFLTMIQNGDTVNKCWTRLVLQ